MNLLQQYLPFIIPVAVLEVGLEVAALVHLFRHKKTRTLNVAVWAVLIIVFNLIGSVCYFVFGREEN